MKITDSHEFKPILSEIEDAPVNPLGRFIFWTVVAVSIFTILWLTIGQVDIVATARGRVIPQGKIKTIQPLDTGVVSKIMVQEGEHVHKGQVLMEIEPDTTEPMYLSSKESLDYNELESQRINAMLAGRPFNPDYSRYSPEAVATQMTLYHSGMDGLNSQISAKNSEKEQLQQQISTVLDTQRQVRQLLDMAEARYNRLYPVRDVVSRDDFDTVEKDLITLRHQKEEADYKLAEMRQHSQQIDSELRLIRENFHNTLLNDLSQRDKSQIEYSAKARELKFHAQKQQVKSPVDGVVDTLSIHTIGGVVTPAEKLVTIVPDGARLLLEAQVTNRDIGFVHPGQHVTIKVDTYDFQRYGTLPGNVLKVSSDSHTNAEATASAMGQVNNAGQASIEDTDKLAEQQVYTAIIAPEKMTLNVDGSLRSIRPGMTVTTEIKVGKRRIIEFFISPLVKSLDRSLKLR